jgi:hypothetical protein
MTDRREPPDLRIRAALREGTPEHAPDGLLQAVVERTADLPQRRRPSWSWLMTSGALATGAAGLLILAFVVGFWRLGPSQTQPGASVPTVGATAPIPSIPVDGSCQPDSVCLGIMPAGTASTRVLSPSLQFTVPARWMNRVDQGGVFELRPIDRPLDLIGVYRHPEAVEDGRMVPGIEERSDALMAFLQGDPELTVTSVQADVTVGGLPGMVADVMPAPGAASSSLDCPGAKCVTILSGLDAAERPVWGFRTVLPADSRSRIYFLDSADGVVLIQITAWNASTFDELLASAGPIVHSFRFSQ